jgi:hypothetical protein
MKKQGKSTASMHAVLMADCQKRVRYHHAHYQIHKISERLDDAIYGIDSPKKAGKTKKYWNVILTNALAGERHAVSNYKKNEAMLAAFLCVDTFVHH